MNDIRENTALTPEKKQLLIDEEVCGSAFNASGADARHERTPTRARSAEAA